MSAQPVFFRGTFAPFFRALDSPIAIACLRLLALPFLPLRCVPFLVLLTAFFTSRPALVPYFAMRDSPISRNLAFLQSTRQDVCRTFGSQRDLVPHFASPGVEIGERIKGRINRWIGDL